MLQFEHPILFIAAAMILSLLLALFIYHKDVRFSSASRSTKFVLVCLRFLSLSILILLLFKPKWLNEIKKVEKPIIVFLQDASSSILNHEDSTYYKNEFLRLIEDNNNKLATDFDLYSYHFSDSIYEGLNSNYQGKSSDISKAFQNISDRFHNRNLAAIILASDGNYNKGMHPFYQIEALNAPIYSLALGDSTLQQDLVVESVRHNDIAYYQNEFPLEFEVASNFNSSVKHKIEVTNNGKVLFEDWTYLKAQTPISKQIFIEASQEGIQYYDISISSFEGEKNSTNNTQRVAIEVLNNLQNILILSSAPHPDIAALRSALEEGKNYNVTQQLFHEFKGEIEAYNLIVLHQIPDYTKRNKALLTKILKSETSLFIIGGKGSNWSEFNKIQNVVELKTKNYMQEVFPVINSNFKPFELSKECQSFIKSAPPLLAPFGDVVKKDLEHSLFKQNIKGIDTNNDLLFFAKKDEKQIAILLAEGIWKWRLFDSKRNQTQANFNEWVQSISQYLTLNKDKRKLRLHYPKIINSGNAFSIDAHLYNDSYQLIKDAEISLQLQNEKGEDYFYSLNSENTNYTTQIYNLSEGDYHFIVEAKHKQELVKLEGDFVVLTSNLEQQKQEANWSILNKISDASQGKFITKSEFNTYSDIISETIEGESKVYFSKQLSDLIKQKLIFLVFLLSLFIEWVIRKRLGTH